VSDEMGRGCKRKDKAVAERRGRGVEGSKEASKGGYKT
jgi:hypothetical protein